MDARTLCELRQLAVHVGDISDRLADGLDELTRRISALEDVESERVEAQARIRRLADERVRLRGGAAS